MTVHIVVVTDTGLKGAASEPLVLRGGISGQCGLMGVDALRSSHCGGERETLEPQLYTGDRIQTTNGD